MTVTSRAVRPDRFTTGRRMGVVVSFCLAGALLFPLAVLFFQFWTSIDGAVTAVRTERAGVAYLRPVVRLISALDAAQSSAVRAQTVDPGEIYSAEQAMATADREATDSTGVHQRWADLKIRIDALVGDQRPSGQAAFRAYGAVIDLTSTLLGEATGDTALFSDPGAETVPLITVTARRLPEVLVNAGRIADLTTLDANRPRPSATRPRDREQPLPPADPAVSTGIALARDRASSAAGEVGGLLRRNIEATPHDAFAQTLLRPLDTFRVLADKVAPPIDPLAQFSPSVDDGSVALARLDLNRAVVDLEQAVAPELDSLLADRENGLTTRRSVSVGAVGLGLALALGLLWFRLPNARGREPSTPDWPREEDETGERQRSPETMDYSVLDARDLVPAEELVHIGRALRSPPREHDDASG
ncbi:hypothetical protein [Amycolatopsis sp. H20-H5]|uniref:hypothetical protein n=1 Tax=Amycolatopsis sp. H20-H5 TaxID=3046309 RepID=UPI002DB6431C|nr:hypothetical protein [Amycolatopsis sp. H20-H5]MEC3982593.1 hypothetical protein [Amycolatopsis sp. H20-H5]